MKYLAITLIVFLILGATGYRVTRIKLEPKVVAAYQRGRPRGISRVTWADMKIRQDVRDKVAKNLRFLNNEEFIPDVNEIAR